MRTVLGIAVPKVLAWSAGADNPVKSEYIVMEEAAGTQLSAMWDGMQLDERFCVIGEIVATQKKLMSLSFSR